MEAEFLLVTEAANVGAYPIVFYVVLYSTRAC